jgi:sugar-specific transcriptional regulator TrmB
LKELKKHPITLDDTKETDNEFIFSLIKGQKTIMDKLAEHNPKAKKEILGVQRNWKVWGQGLREMQKTVKKGVEVKIIGVINEETKSRVLEWKKTGAKIKAYNPVYGEYPLRFTIFDNKEARITIGKPEIPNPEDYITVWTKSKPLISILRSQFLDMWKNSIPIEQALK